LGSERIDVVPTDAAGDYIIGADAPAPTLTSSNTQIATIATPPPSAQNRFTINGPFANGPPKASAVPAPGATFQLNATIASANGTPLRRLFPIALDRTICGVFSEFTISTANANAYYIASGPDGALWFTEEGLQGDAPVPSKIGRVTTSGKITETTLATGYESAEDITAGSDGALYFVEFSQSPFGRAIGRITAAGTITSNTSTPNIDNDGELLGTPGGGAWIGDFAGSSSSSGITAVSGSGQATQLPIAGASYLWGLATGSDGNVWYTDYGAGDIGEVSPAGTPIATYQLQDGDKAPLWMTLGPDGNVWFVAGTTTGTSAVYSVTSSGALTRFTAPYLFNFIAAGPDGALWLSPDGNPAIVRMTTSGAVTAPFRVPSGDNANSITLGPDGNLWFVEPHKNNVGRLQ